MSKKYFLKKSLAEVEETKVSSDEEISIEKQERSYEVRTEDASIICISSSSDDETNGFENHPVVTDVENDDDTDSHDLYKPELTQCHLCNEKFYTKSMLRKHIELHEQNIIHLAGQSVVPLSWIGRQPLSEAVPSTKVEREVSRREKKQLKRKTQAHANPKIIESREFDNFTLSDSTSSSNMSTPISSPVKKKDKIEYRDMSNVKGCRVLQGDSNLDLYDNDQRLPIVLRENKGVQTKDAINFIINENNVEKQQIATVVPTDISENVAFLIDTKAVGCWKNVLSDDMGAWKSTCVANRYYKWDKKGELRSITKTEFEHGCFHVYRYQYVNLSSPDLHRVIIRVCHNQKMFNTVFVQYYFEGDEHRVLIKPHGNRHQDNKPYKRTQETVKNSIQKLSKTKKPKDVFHTILENSGGIENLSSGSQKPRDKQQIYNYNRKEKGDEILETMDMRMNEDLKFIREIEMVPEFAVFLSTPNQLSEMEKFCTNNSNFSVVGIDTTFNIGQYYVTITTFRNLMFQHKSLKHEPVMIGPTLIHQRRTYDSFFMLPSCMIREKPSLGNIIVFGTDGEVNLTRAFESCLPFSEHLLCDIHMKDNIISKLATLNVTGLERQLYLKDIFGKQIQDTLIPGLVDCLTGSAFDKKMKELHSLWVERHDNGSKFYEYFMEHKSELIKKCMTSSLRSKCGLGYPPKPYTQNANECINSVVKSDLNSKKQKVPEFIKSLKRTVLRQEAEIKLALTNQSDFKLKCEYSFLAISEDKYFKMDRKQKESVYQKYLNAALKQRDADTISDEENDNTGQDVTLSISPESCGVTSVPFPTLKNMFHKAATLFHSNTDIVPLPGNTGASTVAGKYFITSSCDINKPHLTTVYHSGQVTCDNACPRWELYKICSHALAAAENCESLKRFIDWYKDKCKSGSININFAGAANMDMPTGRGKKGNRATQVRKGSSNKFKVTVTSYESEKSSTKKLPYPKPPDGGYILYLLDDCDVKVKKCYGCSGNLRHNGNIPPSPGNLVVVTRTRREYIKDGVKTLGDISNVYFHLSERCIKLHNSYFVPSLVYVAPDVSRKLDNRHKELLKQCSIPY